MRQTFLKVKRPFWTFKAVYLGIGGKANSVYMLSYYNDFLFACKVVSKNKAT